LGPTTRRATTRMTMSSNGPMLNILETGRGPGAILLLGPQSGGTEVRPAPREARDAACLPWAAMSSAMGWISCWNRETVRTSRIACRTSAITAATIATAVTSPMASHTTNGADTPTMVAEREAQRWLARKSWM